MTNAIPNVPRELKPVLAMILNALDRDAADGKQARAEMAAELRALLSAPSPAGVDGLETIGYATESELAQLLDPTMPTGKYVRIGLDHPTCWKEDAPCEHLVALCVLSDAQAIIDGLRGEVEALQSMITDLSKVGIRMRSERDNQARRIGELETALEFSCKSLAQVTSSDGSGHADIAVSVLRMAGRKEADASQIVETYKAGAKWRIDFALSAGKDGE